MPDLDPKEIFRQKQLSPQQVLKDRVIPWLILIFASVCVLFVLVFFVYINVYAVRNLVKYQNRISHGATASGTITRDWDIYSEDLGNNRWVEYSFPATVNGKQTWVGGSSKDHHRSLSVGQTIEVIYDVSDPYNNSLKDNGLGMDFSDLIFEGFVFILFIEGFVVLFILIRYLIRAVFKRRMAG